MSREGGWNEDVVAAGDVQNLSSGGCPAASDLTARYKDVRTRLDGLSIVHLFRAISLCIQGCGNQTLSATVPRVLSVRTEDLSAGLLHVGEPPCSR